ncbi:ester cyclase [Sphingomonas lenta]|uniref:Polyketide cyclase n=1 Tax=Sphingomonas lenta TaxID=1141887 RepID=A0A2A2SIL9_9SPHN|nr:ester cyclase [Sphingomonas lenta]PAX09079.1 polyketide cyclase [Sphingomonas lenta]
MRPITAPYPDVPSFIYGCTREIWEERGVGAKLARYYAEDCLVRAPSGLTTSMKGVAADTLQTLHQFPDRELVGEDVIWDDGGDRSFLSSHRLISVMRHLGNGSFGAATGALVKSRIIADCWVRDGVITEEWLVRDGAAFARSLGLAPSDLAARLCEQDRAAGRPITFFTPADDRVGAYRPRVADDPAVELVVAAYSAIWGEKTPAAIRGHYFPGVAVALPGGEVANGAGELDRFVVGLLASIPDATLSIHSATVNRESEKPVRVAIRWSLDGHQTGWGRFGCPTSAPLHVMGLSHLHVSEQQIVAEWFLIDEVSIWKQILAHTR